MKKVGVIIEFFVVCDYILCVINLKHKNMTTTIRTNSKNYFNKIQKYITNKRVFFAPSVENGVYALTIFDLDSFGTNALLNKMTKHFHLSPKQQEPLALAA